MSLAAFGALFVLAPTTARATAVSGTKATTPPFGRPISAAPNGPMAYHGGPVQHHARVFLIFWGPGYNSDPSGIVNAQEKLFASLARSTYNGMMDQYSDGKGNITNDVVLSDAWVDPKAPGGTVGDFSAQTEVNRAISQNNWPTGINDQYIVLPQPGSFIQLTDASFCAEHFYNGGPVYSLIPHPGDPGLPSYCATWGGSSNVSHVMTSLSSHEYAETLTDPEVDAWYELVNGANWEIADLCEPTSGKFGTVSAQFLYSNKAGGCIGPGASGPGPTWTVQKSVDPTGSPDSRLRGISCSSTTHCTAVGFGDNASFSQSMLAERWNDVGWKQQTLPEPSDVADSTLASVSCPTVNSCVAVGDYDNSHGTQLVLAERWNGSGWSLLAPKVPSGASASAFDSISCSSATSCTAVGDYLTGAPAKNVPLAERWNGSSWSVQSTPDPAGAASAVLNGVSCPNLTSCTAVGQYDDGSGTTLTLAERWNGSGWSMQASPNPSSVEITLLSSVSCSSTTACEAVGSYSTTSFSGGHTLAEGWNGTKWAIQPSPTPTGANYPGLFGVSCPMADGCTAVGYYTTGSSVTVTLAEAWNGTSWRTLAPKNPSGGTSISGFTSVSCHYSLGCTAAGLYGGSNDYPLIERYQ